MILCTLYNLSLQRAYKQGRGGRKFESSHLDSLMIDNLRVSDSQVIFKSTGIKKEQAV